MLWRKVDPDERQEVINLLVKLSLASKEIDRAADRMKLQFAGLNNIEVASQVMASITDVLETVENVRADTTKPGYWPTLKDESGGKRMAEIWVLREEVFKHQLWRLKSYRDLVAALIEGREDENLALESIKATEAYENVLDQMSSMMIKLGKRYKISVLEFAQL